MGLWRHSGPFAFNSWLSPRNSSRSGKLKLPPYPNPVPRESESNRVGFPEQNLHPELEQLIEVIVRALAQQNLPAVVVLPSDDLSVARAACAHLTEPGEY